MRTCKQRTAPLRIMSYNLGCNYCRYLLIVPSEKLEKSAQLMPRLQTKINLGNFVSSLKLLYDSPIKVVKNHSTSKM